MHIKISFQENVDLMDIVYKKTTHKDNRMTNARRKTTKLITI
jgi:hypothetical protein